MQRSILQALGMRAVAEGDRQGFDPVHALRLPVQGRGGDARQIPVHHHEPETGPGSSYPPTR